MPIVDVEPRCEDGDPRCAYASAHGSARFVQKVAWHSKFGVGAPVADVVHGLGQVIASNHAAVEFLVYRRRSRVLGDQAAR
jgi:hypothetical protein